MLRVSEGSAENGNNYLQIDKKKKQISLTDPGAIVAANSSQLARAPMVSAPKIFAFDGLFTRDDAQVRI